MLSLYYNFYWHLYLSSSTDMNLLAKGIFRGISNTSGHSANNMKKFYKESNFKVNDKPAHSMHKLSV